MAAHQAPLSTGFSRQEYWSGLPFTSLSIPFNPHIFVNFSVFFLLLASSFIPQWSKKMLNMISIFVNLLKLVLRSNIRSPRGRGLPSMRSHRVRHDWSDLATAAEDVPCTNKKNVYSVAFGWNVLYKSVKLIWSNESFKADVSLLVFFLGDLDFPGGSDGKVSVYNAVDPGSIPGLGRSPGEENGNPLQDYCLENPMDRGAW